MGSRWLTNMECGGRVSCKGNEHKGSAAAMTSVGGKARVPWSLAITKFLPTTVFVVPDYLTTAYNLNDMQPSTIWLPWCQWWQMNGGTFV